MRAKRQAGFVSIIVTIIFALIISTITISFSVLMSREQRQALDDQLSAQAFYAAESAANYAKTYDIANKTTCDLPPALVSNPLDSSGTIASTCVLVNNNPSEIAVDSVSTDNPTIFQIETLVDKLTFAWQDPAGGTSFNTTAAPNDVKFTPAATWPATRPGVVEVTIYPITPTVNYDQLVKTSRTFYLYPSTLTEASEPPYSGTDAQIYRGACSDKAPPLIDCSVTVAGLPETAAELSALGDTSGQAPTGYILRLRSVYKAVTMQINGKTAANAAVTLAGAQKVVDVTGKAGDVVRRVQIRYGIRPSFTGPLYAIETVGDICKKLDVWPGGASDLCP